jgi:hypothetical protein
MANITIIQSVIVDGTPRAFGDAISTSLASARPLISAGSAKWTAPAYGPGLPNSAALIFLPDITQATGGTAASLDSQCYAGIPTGRLFSFLVSGVLKTFELRGATGLAAEGSSIISGPDFDATTNNRFLVQIS